MTLAPTRQFVPGTTGWTVDDLDDPRIAPVWERGHYELIEGVLATMPAAYFEGGQSLFTLAEMISHFLKSRGTPGKFSFETDLVLTPTRVPRPDAMLMTEEDLRKHRALPARGRRALRYGRIRVPPTLVIESVSLDHEAHDEVTKRRWYADAEVPNYWLLNAYRRSLECLVLDGPEYRVDQAGRGKVKLRPGAFPGLLVPLAQLWA